MPARERSHAKRIEEVSRKAEGEAEERARNILGETVPRIASTSDEAVVDALANIGNLQETGGEAGALILEAQGEAVRELEETGVLGEQIGQFEEILEANEVFLKKAGEMAKSLETEAKLARERAKARKEEGKTEAAEKWLNYAKAAEESAKLYRAARKLVPLLEKEVEEAGSQYGAGNLEKANAHLERATYIREYCSHLTRTAELNMAGEVKEQKFTQKLMDQAPKIAKSPKTIFDKKAESLYLKSNVELNSGAVVTSAEIRILHLQESPHLSAKEKKRLIGWEQERKATAEQALSMVHQKGAGKEAVKGASELLLFSDAVYIFRMEAETKIENSEAQVSLIGQIRGMGKKERKKYIENVKKHINDLPLTFEQKKMAIASQKGRVRRIAGLSEKEAEEEISWHREFIKNTRRAQRTLDKTDAGLRELRKANETLALELQKFEVRIEARESAPLQEAAEAQFAAKGELTKSQQENLAGWLEETGMHTTSEAQELARRNKHLTEKQRKIVAGWLEKAAGHLEEANKLLGKKDMDSGDLQRARQLLRLAKSARVAAYEVHRASASINVKKLGVEAKGLSAKNKKESQAYLRGVIDEAVKMHGESLGFLEDALEKEGSEKKTREELASGLGVRAGLMLAGGEAYARALRQAGKHREYRKKMQDSAGRIQHGIEKLRDEKEDIRASYTYIKEGDNQVELYLRLAMQDRFDRHGFAPKTRLGRALAKSSKLARNILRGKGKWGEMSYSKRFEIFENLLAKQRECGRTFTAYNFAGSEIKENGERMAESTLAERNRYHRKKLKEKTGEKRVATPIDRAQGKAVDALESYNSYLSAKPGREEEKGKTAEKAHAAALARERSAKKRYRALAQAKMEQETTASRLVAAQPEWAGVQFRQTEEGLLPETRGGTVDEFRFEKRKGEQLVEENMKKNNVEDKFGGVYYAAQGVGSLSEAEGEFYGALEDARRGTVFRYAGRKLQEKDAELAREIEKLQEKNKGMGGSEIIADQIAELKVQRKKIWEKAGKAEEYAEMENEWEKSQARIAELDEKRMELREKMEENKELIQKNEKGIEDVGGLAKTDSLEHEIERLEKENVELGQQIANLDVEQDRVKRKIDEMRVGPNEIDGVIEGTWIEEGEERVSIADAERVVEETIGEADRVLEEVTKGSKYAALESLILDSSRHAEELSAMSKSKGPIASGAYEANIEDFKNRAKTHFEKSREYLADGNYREAQEEYEEGVDELRQMAATAKRRNTKREASYSAFEEEAKTRIGAWDILMEEAPVQPSEPEKMEKYKEELAAYKERRQKALAVVGVLNDADINRASLHGWRLGYLGTDELGETEELVDGVLAKKDSLALASLSSVQHDLASINLRIHEGNTRADWIETGVRIGAELVIPQAMLTSILTSPIEYMGQTGEFSWDAAASAGVMVVGRALRMPVISEVMGKSMKYAKLVKAYGMLEIGYFSGVSGYHAGVGLQEWRKTGTLSVDTASSALFALLPLAHRPGVQKFKRSLVRKAAERLGLAEKTEFFTLKMHVEEPTGEPSWKYRAPEENLRPDTLGARAEAIETMPKPSIRPEREPAVRKTGLGKGLREIEGKIAEAERLREQEQETGRPSVKRKQLEKEAAEQLREMEIEVLEILGGKIAVGEEGLRVIPEGFAMARAGPGTRISPELLRGSLETLKMCAGISPKRRIMEAAPRPAREDARQTTAKSDLIREVQREYGIPRERAEAIVETGRSLAELVSGTGKRAKVKYDARLSADIQKILKRGKREYSIVNREVQQMDDVIELVLKLDKSLPKGEKILGKQAEAVRKSMESDVTLAEKIVKKTLAERGIALVRYQGGLELLKVDARVEAGGKTTLIVTSPPEKKGALSLIKRIFPGKRQTIADITGGGVFEPIAQTLIVPKGSGKQVIVHELEHYAGEKLGVWSRESRPEEKESTAIAAELIFGSEMNGREILQYLINVEKGFRGETRINKIYQEAARKILDSHSKLRKIANEVAKGRRSIDDVPKGFVKKAVTDYIDGVYLNKGGIKFSKLIKIGREHTKRRSTLEILGITEPVRVREIEMKIGAEGLKQRANALARAFRGMERTGREVLEARPELLTKPQAEFEADIRRFKETRKIVTRIKKTAAEKGLQLPEEMVSDVRPYLSKNFRDEIALYFARKKVEGILGRGEAEIKKAGKVPLELRASVESKFEGVVTGPWGKEFTLKGKTYTRGEVQELGEVIHYAEKMVRGERTVIPLELRPAVEKLAGNAEFKKSVKILKGLEKVGEPSAPHFRNQARSKEFELALEALEETGVWLPHEWTRVRLGGEQAEMKSDLPETWKDVKEGQVFSVETRKPGERVKEWEIRYDGEMEGTGGSRMYTIIRGPVPEVSGTTRAAKPGETPFEGISRGLDRISKEIKGREFEQLSTAEVEAMGELGEELAIPPEKKIPAKVRAERMRILGERIETLEKRVKKLEAEMLRAEREGKEGEAYDAYRTLEATYYELENCRTDLSKLQRAAEKLAEPGKKGSRVREEGKGHSAELKNKLDAETARRRGEGEEFTMDEPYFEEGYGGLLPRRKKKAKIEDYPDVDEFHEIKKLEGEELTEVQIENAMKLSARENDLILEGVYGKQDLTSPDFSIVCNKEGKIIAFGKKAPPGYEGETHTAYIHVDIKTGEMEVRGIRKPEIKGLEGLKIRKSMAEQKAELEKEYGLEPGSLPKPEVEAGNVEPALEKIKIKAKKHPSPEVEIIKPRSQVWKRHEKRIEQARKEGDLPFTLEGELPKSFEKHYSEIEARAKELGMTKAEKEKFISAWEEIFEKLMVLAESGITSRGKAPRPKIIRYIEAFNTLSLLTGKMVGKRNIKNKTEALQFAEYYSRQTPLGLSETAKSSVEIKPTTTDVESNPELLKALSRGIRSAENTEKGIKDLVAIMKELNLFGEEVGFKGEYVLKAFERGGVEEALPLLNRVLNPEGTYLFLNKQTGKLAVAKVEGMIISGEHFAIAIKPAEGFISPFTGGRGAAKYDPDARISIIDATRAKEWQRLILDRHEHNHHRDTNSGYTREVRTIGPEEIVIPRSEEYSKAGELTHQLSKRENPQEIMKYLKDLRTDAEWGTAAEIMLEHISHKAKNPENPTLAEIRETSRLVQNRNERLALEIETMGLKLLEETKSAEGAIARLSGYLAPNVARARPLQAEAARYLMDRISEFSIDPAKPTRGAVKLGIEPLVQTKRYQYLSEITKWIEKEDSLEAKLSLLQMYRNSDNPLKVAAANIFMKNLGLEKSPARGLGLEEMAGATERVKELLANSYALEALEGLSAGQEWVRGEYPGLSESQTIQKYLMEYGKGGYGQKLAAELLLSYTDHVPKGPEGSPKAEDVLNALSDARILISERRDRIEAMSIAAEYRFAPFQISGADVVDMLWERATNPFIPHVYQMAARRILEKTGLGQIALDLNAGRVKRGEITKEAVDQRLKKYMDDEYMDVLGVYWTNVYGKQGKPVPVRPEFVWVPARGETGKTGTETPTVRIEAGGLEGNLPAGKIKVRGGEIKGREEWEHEVPKKHIPLNREQAIFAVEQNAAGEKLSPKAKEYLSEHFEKRDNRFSPYEAPVVARNIAKLLEVLPSQTITRTIKGNRQQIKVYYEPKKGRILTVDKPPKTGEYQEATLTFDPRQGRIITVDVAEGTPGEIPFWRTGGKLKGLQFQESVPGYERIPTEAVVKRAGKKGAGEFPPLNEKQQGYLREHFRRENILYRDAEAIAHNSSVFMGQFPKLKKTRGTITLDIEYNAGNGRLIVPGTKAEEGATVKKAKVTIDLEKGKIKKIELPKESGLGAKERLKTLEGLKFREEITPESPVHEVEHPVQIMEAAGRGEAETPREKGKGYTAEKAIKKLRKLGMSAPPLEALIEKSAPEVRWRIVNSYSKAIKEQTRVSKVEEARKARTPEEETAQEMEALENMGLGRLAKKYKGGDTGRMMLLVKELGIEIPSITRGQQLNSSIIKIRGALESKEPGRISEVAREHGIKPGSIEKMSSQLNKTLDKFSEELKGLRETMPKKLRQIFGLVIRGNLEKRLNRLPKYKGHEIKKIETITGLRGAFAITLAKGRERKKVFVKLENLEPAELGKRLAETTGLFTSDIYYGFEHPTGLKVGKKKVMQKFGIIEDIHEYAGKTVRMRVPTGKTDSAGREITSTEPVKVLGVSMVLHELLIKPDAKNPAHELFYRMMSSKEGRRKIFKAWNRYQEMSRRVLLGDRHMRNTALMVVKRKGSDQLTLTFQPIDLDMVADFGSGKGGKPDFGRMARDFREGTAWLLDIMGKVSATKQMDELTESGHRLGPEQGISFEQLRKEYHDAGYPTFAEDTPIKEVDGIIRKWKGKPFGPGFEVMSPKEPRNIGDLSKYGGTTRVRADDAGRFILHNPEYLADILEFGLRPQEHIAFWREMRNIKKPKK